MLVPPPIFNCLPLVTVYEIPNLFDTYPQLQAGRLYPEHILSLDMWGALSKNL